MGTGDFVMAKPAELSRSLFEVMEARVGIEPALTDLQSAA